MATATARATGWTTCLRRNHDHRHPCRPCLHSCGAGFPLGPLRCLVLGCEAPCAARTGGAGRRAARWEGRVGRAKHGMGEESIRWVGTRSRVGCQDIPGYIKKTRRAALSIVSCDIAAVLATRTPTPTYKLVKKRQDMPHTGRLGSAYTNPSWFTFAVRFSSRRPARVR